jgi:putative transposase
VDHEDQSVLAGADCDALRQAQAGTPVEETCRKLGVSEPTFYRWKKQSGRLGVPKCGSCGSSARRIANSSSSFADLTLDKQILREAVGKRF